MSQWEMVKLGDVCELRNGRAYKQTELLDDGKYPVLRVGNFFSNKGWYYSNLELDENTYCDFGDLLFAWSASFGPKIWDGKKVIFHYHIWRMDLINTVDKKYMYYILLNMSEKIKATGRGIAMIHTTKGEMEEVKIPLPPLEKQQHMAKTLDLASEIIEGYRQKLTELEKLVQSVFYEMFGDPVENEKGWEMKAISDVATVKIGPFGSLLHQDEYVPDQYPLINPSHIKDSKIVADTNLTVSYEKYQTLSAYQLKIGDLVLGRRGEMGRYAVVEEDNFLCGTGSLIIRPNEQINLYILQKIITTSRYKRIIEDSAVGQTMKNLNVPIVSKLKIPLPPLPLQEQFAQIVEKIEEEKALVQEGLREAEQLFGGLLQGYFEG